jgi:hypothetical protein
MKSLQNHERQEQVWHGTLVRFDIVCEGYVGTDEGRGYFIPRPLLVCVGAIPGRDDHAVTPCLEIPQDRQLMHCTVDDRGIVNKTPITS